MFSCRSVTRVHTPLTATLHGSYNFWWIVEFFACCTVGAVDWLRLAGSTSSGCPTSCWAAWRTRCLTGRCSRSYRVWRKYSSWRSANCRTNASNWRTSSKVRLGIVVYCNRMSIWSSRLTDNIPADSGFMLTDRHLPMAKQKLNWGKENRTLSPLWRNLKFYIRRRFIFRTGVWYKTIRILYNDSYTAKRGDISHSCMESYDVEAQLLEIFLRDWSHIFSFSLIGFG